MPRNTRDQSTVDMACQMFGLGVRRHLAPVRGGASNRLWRLTTDRGQFAVKEFNSDREDPTWLPRVLAACEIERAAYETGTVPMAAPVALPSGHYIASLETPDGMTALIRVHVWVEGHSVPETVQVETARRFGALTAKVHELQLPVIGADVQRHPPFGMPYWQMLASRLGQTHPKLGTSLETSFADIAAAESLLAESSSPRHELMTHRDIKPANTLTLGGELVLLDWDGAGPFDRDQEVIKVALWMAGTEVTDAVDPDLFTATLDAYLGAGGELGEASITSFGGYVRDLVAWINANARRCVGATGFHDASLAAREVSRTASRLPRILGQLDAWTALLRVTRTGC